LGRIVSGVARERCRAKVCRQKRKRARVVPAFCVGRVEVDAKTGDEPCNGSVGVDDDEDLAVGFDLNARDDRKEAEAEGAQGSHIVIVS